jgi:hypothetical protein
VEFHIPGLLSKEASCNSHLGHLCEYACPRA